MERQSYTQSEISNLFRKKEPAWFSRHKSDLMTKHGFPPPLPGVGHPIWSRAQVETWFATGGRTFEPEQAGHHGSANDDFDALIAARLAAMAGDDEPAAA